MQQNNRPVMHARQELGKRLLLCRLVVYIPVHIGKAPEIGTVAELLRHLQILLAVFALRRTVEPRHRLTDRFFVSLLDRRHFRLKRRHIADLGHVVMMIGVVADQMPLLRHAAQKLRRRLDIMPHHKKCRWGVMLFQRVQNLRRIAVFVSRVKGQIQHLLRCVADIKRIICRQRLRADVAYRRLPLLLKAQPPIAGGRRRSDRLKRQDHRRQCQRRQPQCRHHAAGAKPDYPCMHVASLPCHSMRNIPHFSRKPKNFPVRA